MGGDAVWQATCAGREGGYVAAGMRPNVAGTNWDIAVVALDANGQPVGSVTRLDEIDDGGTHARPELAVAPGGEVAVTWQRLFVDGGSLRFLDAQLQTEGPEIDLGPMVSSDLPSVTTHGDGFFVTWSTEGAGGAFELLGQTFSKNGVVRGAALRLNEGGATTPVFPAASCPDAGRCVVVWVTVGGGQYRGVRRVVRLDGGAFGSETPLTMDTVRPYSPAVVAVPYGAWAFWVGSPNVVRGTSFVY